MQVETGCKINVSPASGQDVEREIGLIGSRDSIERAKGAIMEKVHAVVSIFLHLLDPFTDASSSKRRTAVREIQDVVMTLNIVNSLRPSPEAISIPLVSATAKFNHNRRPLIQIHTPHTVATKIMSPFGTLVKCNSSSKLNKIPKVPQPLEVT